MLFSVIIEMRLNNDKLLTNNVTNSFHRLTFMNILNIKNFSYIAVMLNVPQIIAVILIYDSHC